MQNHNSQYFLTFKYIKIFRKYSCHDITFLKIGATFHASFRIKYNHLGSCNMDLICSNLIQFVRLLFMQLVLQNHVLQCVYILNSTNNITKDDLRQTRYITLQWFTVHAYSTSSNRYVIRYLTSQGYTALGTLNKILSH